jgi:NADH-quinone oxidoreductase chain I
MFRYFGRIFASLASCVDGMMITGRYLFRYTLVERPITMQYPDEKWNIPDGYRGTVKTDTDKCIVCKICVSTCPVSCIEIEGEKRPEEKKKVVTRWDVDTGRCIFCGMCAEACPQGAIEMTKEYELACYGREEARRHWAKTGGMQAPAASSDGKPPAN